MTTQYEKKAFARRFKNSEWQTLCSKKYAGYTARLPKDPSYYGTSCSNKDAEGINKRLRSMIKRHFDGVNVEEWSESMGGNAATFGPDQTICDEIDQWISDNWIAAI